MQVAVFNVETLALPGAEVPLSNVLRQFITIQRVVI